MRVIIFDFDGTIADSFTTLLGVFEEITDRQQKLTADEIKKLRGLRLGGILKYLGIKKWQIPRLVIKAKRSMKIKIDGIKPFAGLPQVLGQLRDEEFQMYILSSNSSENITKFLRANKLDSYFTKIYGDIGLRSKASAIKRLLKKERLNRRQCFYVGDEVRDIEGAKKAGVAVVAVGWGFNHAQTLKLAKPSALAASPQDLLKILRKKT